MSDRLVASGGLLAPRFDYSFIVAVHRESWLTRLLLRAPATWEEVIYTPPPPPLRDILPRLTATRGGVTT